MKCNDIRINGLTLRRVRVGDVRADHAYQRDLDERRIRRMAERWDDAMSGVVVVSERDDGLYVIDGQHRIAAQVAMGQADKMIAVDVRRGLTLQQEADLFYRLNGPNGQCAVKAYFKYRARLVAEEPVAVEINSILRSLSLRAVPGACKMGVAAVTTCENIHRQSHNLKATLRVLVALSRAHDHDPAAYDKELIYAVGCFLADFPAADEEVLVAKLRVKAAGYGPRGIIAHIAHEQKLWRDEPKRSCVPSTLLRIYNKSNRKPLTRDDRVDNAA